MGSPVVGTPAGIGRTGLHIGIVGCSAEGAALCYRTICTDAPALLGGHDHPPVSLHTHSLGAYVRCLDAGDLDGVADLMLDSARRLAAAGADFLICPDNTVHQALDRVSPRSPLPWLHIADGVGAAAQRQGWRRVGLMGTRWLVDSEVYPSRLAPLGIEVLRPPEADRDAVDRVIMDELVRGLVRPASVQVLHGVIGGFARQGCDAVVLGCTELPLAIDAAAGALPTLDSTRLLARAALQRALHPTDAPAA